LGIAASFESFAELPLEIAPNRFYWSVWEREPTLGLFNSSALVLPVPLSSSGSCIIKEWGDKGIHRKILPVSALVTPLALARWI
jgi:hypothetical protein